MTIETMNMIEAAIENAKKADMRDKKEKYRINLKKEMVESESHKKRVAYRNKDKEYTVKLAKDALKKKLESKGVVHAA